MKQGMENEDNMKRYAGLKYALCVSAMFFVLQLFQVFASEHSKNDIYGAWHGKLHFGSDSITVVFRFLGNEDGVMKCTMDSPDQGANGIPAEVEYVSNDSVRVLVPSLMASFEGRIAEEKIPGMFIQRGFRFPLTLKEGEPVLHRPQTPKPPYPYFTEEVSFTNISDGTKLAGTLVMPVGYEKGVRDKPAVVLFVTGSGQQDRNEELFEHKPFLVIADYLARNGIASLRYDDRGIGSSDFGSVPVTLESNRDDAAAGVEYLKSTGLFGKVGVLGHSEGGLISYMLAGDGKIDFAVSLAGPALRGDTLLVAQNRMLLIASGIPELVAESYGAVLSQLFLAEIEGREISDLDAVVEKYGGENIPEELKGNFSVVVRMIKSPWFGSYLKYNPYGALTAVACPVFALSGEKDLQVPSDLNLKTLRHCLPANPQHMIKSYPDLNHLFQHCTTGVVTEYRNIEETISEEVLEDIVQWIGSL